MLENKSLIGSLRRVSSRGSIRILTNSLKRKISNSKLRSQISFEKLKRKMPGGSPVNEHAETNIIESARTEFEPRACSFEDDVLKRARQASARRRLRQNKIISRPTLIHLWTCYSCKYILKNPLRFILWKWNARIIWTIFLNSYASMTHKLCRRPLIVKNNIEDLNFWPVHALHIYEQTILHRLVHVRKFLENKKYN